jgi:uridine kinase
VVVIHVNDYLKKSKGQRVAEDPKYYQLSKLAEHITALKNGKAVTKPKYDPATHSLKGTETVQGKVVIVWGVFALHDDIKDFEDIKVYFESDHFTRVARYFLSEVKNGMAPDEIVTSLLSGFKTNKNLVEPMAKNADYILIDNAPPSFARVPSRKLVDNWRWNRKFAMDELGVLGKVLAGDARHQEEYYIYSDCRSQIIRIRKKSIAFLLMNGSVSDEVWYEFAISPELLTDLVAYYGPSAFKVTRLRVIYEVVGQPFRIFVDRYAEIGFGNALKGIGDFSGIIRRPKRHLTKEIIDDVVARLGLSSATLAKPYHLMR